MDAPQIASLIGTRGYEGECLTSHKLEVCINNLQMGSGAVASQIAKEYPDLQIRRFACLEHCDVCARRPYVLLDDDILIQANSAQELLTEVRQALAHRFAMTPQTDTATSP